MPERTKRRMSCCRKLKEERIRPLSEADVLTPEEVACELKKNRKAVYVWLERNHLVHTILGSQRVIWGEVLAALKQTGKSIDLEQPIRNIPMSKEF